MKNKISKLTIVIFCLLLLALLSNYNAFAADLDFSTNESTTQSFYSVKEETIDMADKGITVVPILNLITEAEVFLNSANYDKLKDKVNEIDLLNREITRIDTVIERTKIKIAELKKLGYNLSSEEVKVSSAADAFSIGDYEGAADYVSGVYVKLDKIILNESEGLVAELQRLDDLQKAKGIGIEVIGSIIDDVSSAKINNDYASIIQVVNQLSKLNDSLMVILRLDAEIKKLTDTSKKTARFNDIKLEAIGSLNNRNYERVYAIGSELDYLLEAINDTEGLIVEVQVRIDEISYMEGIVEINETLNSAIGSLDNEEYEDAQELVHDAYDNLGRLEAQSLLFGTVSVQKIGVKIWRFIKETPWSIPAIIMLLLLLVILYNEAYRVVMIKIYNMKILALESEKKLVGSLIKQSQLEYFDKQVIDKDSYNTSIMKYQERIVKISEKLPILKARIQRLQRKKDEEQ